MNGLPPGVEQMEAGLRFRANVGWLKRGAFAATGGVMLYLMADITGVPLRPANWDWSSILLLPVALMFLGVGLFLVVMAFWQDTLEVTVNRQAVTIRRQNLLRRRQDVWAAADVLSTTITRFHAERNLSASWMVQMTFKGDRYIKSESYAAEDSAKALASAIQAALSRT